MTLTIKLIEQCMNLSMDTAYTYYGEKQNSNIIDKTQNWVKRNCIIMIILVIDNH